MPGAGDGFVTGAVGMRGHERLRIWFEVTFCRRVDCSPPRGNARLESRL